MAKRLPRETIVQVVSYCNAELITDPNFNPLTEYPSDWFVRTFEFVNNPSLALHLGEAFYQARFVYKLMVALNLPRQKNKGIVKFQIIQYASICEALLNHVISTHYKKDFEDRYASVTYSPVEQALSKNTELFYEKTPLMVCRAKTEKASVSWARNALKAEFAAEKGVITQVTRQQYCGLYELRNNAHLLKAASSNYFPTLNEAQSAYELVWRFINEVKGFCLSQTS